MVGCSEKVGVKSKMGGAYRIASWFDKMSYVENIEIVQWLGILLSTICPGFESWPVPSPCMLSSISLVMLGFDSTLVSSILRAFATLSIQGGKKKKKKKKEATFSCYMVHS